MAEAPINGHGMTVQVLFTGRRFGLDYYQREYSWSRHHVRALLSDLHRTFSKNWSSEHDRTEVEQYTPYFLGTLVYHEEQGVTYLVDGQQRLITLHLILIHLRGLLREQDLYGDAGELEQLIWNRRRQTQTFTIDIREHYDLLSALFKGKPYDLPRDASPSLKNLHARSNELVDDFPADLQGEALGYFVDWFLDRVCVVGVQALNRAQGWEIFETTNDRGQRLGQIDLLKRHLLAQARTRQQTLNERWRTAITALSAVDLNAPSDFAKTVLIAQHADLHDQDDIDAIERASHEWVKDNAARLGLLAAPDYQRFVEDDFARLGEWYAALRSASSTWHDDWSEEVFYNAYNNVPHHLTAVLAALRPQDSDGEFHQKAQLISRFLDLLFVRRLFNSAISQASELGDHILRELVRRLRQCVSVADVAKQLSAEIVQLDESGFDGMEKFGLTSGNRPQVRYLLARLTAFAETGIGKRNDITLYLDRDRPFHIEHIWADKHDRYKGEVPRLADFRSWRSRLGCLLLLHESANTALRDDTYRQKVIHYARQNILAASLFEPTYGRNRPLRRFVQQHELGKLLRHFPDFTKTAIEHRQRLYQRLCEIVWDPARLGFALPSEVPARPKPRRAAHYRVRLYQLIDVGMVAEDERLVGRRGKTDYHAQVLSDGRIRVSTGEVFPDLSPAGSFVLNVTSCNGWVFWHVVRNDVRVTLKEVRSEALRTGAVSEK